MTTESITTDQAKAPVDTGRGLLLTMLLMVLLGVAGMYLVSL
ncbi:hypothetical protein GCM10022251_82450 [Phytohabitans flavus]|uniref:Uncharacterized protein n=1 Tax=Phytohabitans flavus TaxID=1076124 RepID=A0A6F8XXS3_9ACTN|nr:hypothetical protein [Phytohabitans flavus]BCB78662.1 hypothetical protein Pflav_050720 [Phytohabitans flavus]